MNNDVFFSTLSVLKEGLDKKPGDKKTLECLEVLIREKSAFDTQVANNTYIYCMHGMYLGYGCNPLSNNFDNAGNNYSNLKQIENKHQ
jgi:hypothetical protein